jgi:outer membrane immunogenic protein
MKKLFIILVLSTVFLYTVGAQYQSEPRGVQLNAGTGFSYWGIPIYVGLDFGVHPDVSIGVESSFRSYNQGFTDSRYRSTIMGLSTNGNYHFNRLLDIPNYWDFYAGMNIGYYFWFTPNNYPGTGASGVGIGAQVGGRYFFNDHFGLNLELGGANTFAGGKFGITYKF